jgi:Calcineurin-like phosphoesterase
MSQITKDTAVNLIKQGDLSNRKIAEVVGVDERTIRRWRREVYPLDLGERQIEEKVGESLTVSFTSTTPITTKEDAAAKAGIDLTQWVVTGVTTKAYQSAMKVKVKGVEKPVVQQLWAIKVSFAPRSGPDTAEAITAMVDGAIKARSFTPSPRLRLVTDAPAIPLMQQIVIADPHLSKLCWPGSTGGEAYDISIARKLVYGGVRYLVDQQPHVTQRTIAFLGDYFHYDTLSGTTTAGTLQDRDSRLPKMLEVGAELAVQSIDLAARYGEVHVVLVPGNHDSVLTIALQRILQAEFRSTPHVTIDDTHTKRKTHVFGKNLFLYDHGDRRKKELPHTLAVEHPLLWGNSTHREIHTGHLHHESEVYHGTATHHGCVLYTHPSMSPPDQWHADEQYIGSMRGMKAFTYLESGGQIAAHTVTSPMLLAA